MNESRTDRWRTGHFSSQVDTARYWKDRVIFVTKEEHEIPSTVKLVEEDTNEDHEVKGLILPSGEINWDCPCLGGMASGACGEQFKTLFTCFHFSQEEVKGLDCLEQFRSVQKCFRQHPELFSKKDYLQSGNPGAAYLCSTASTAQVGKE
uniref:Coiled-coil-helix-coiled-coil-helix domain containing 4b n=1 Tax=Cyprinus carpio TaxID=7962 RepID=A0A8C1LK83_CYPCA